MIGARRFGQPPPARALRPPRPAPVGARARGRVGAWSALAALAVVAVGCATTPGPPPPPREPLRVPGRPAPDSIPWSASRPLAWADFRGQPDMSNSVAAVTTYALAWESDCTSDGFRFAVASVFLPEQSWVKPDVPARVEEGRRTLAHEQTHFDLSEVHARKMRRALARAATPCRLTQAQLESIVEPFIREDQVLQGRYDHETRNGLDVVHQARWDEDVAQQLEALSRYAADAGGPAVERRP